MGSKIFIILFMLTVASFFALMLFTTGDKNKAYVQFILLAFPFLAIDTHYGDLFFSDFDVVTLSFLFGFYSPKKVNLKNGKVYLITFIFLVIIIIVGLYKAESLTSSTTTYCIEYICLFLFAKISVDEIVADPTFFYKIVQCLKIVFLFSLAFLLGQFVLGVGFSLAKVQNPNVLSEGTRYTSFFQDPQKYAQYLAAMSFIFLIKDPTTQKVSTLNYALFLSALVAILFTGGRGGLGGWAAGMFLVILFGKSSYRYAIIVVGILAYIVIDNFKDNIAMFKRTSVDDTYAFRFAIWVDAFKIFLDHKYFGIGLGNYTNYVSVHNPDQFWLVDNEITYYDHPESGYLKFLTELGATGFISIFFMIIFPMAQAFFLFVKNKDSTIILLIAGVIAWMIGFYTVYSFSDVRMTIFIITFLVMLATSYKWSNYNIEKNAATIL
ncbi:O-antigen ligase [Hydrotalea sandarakina]|uniref:O-antigen ligase n=2 Tax=Hydrotalea sandarakina TaxID=1004304 RepID=A0A2W7TNG0_9BACT|nr:O-antigen ligase [Hydrotalea sandarakina]